MPVRFLWRVCVCLCLGSAVWSLTGQRDRGSDTLCLCGATTGPRFPDIVRQMLQQLTKMRVQRSRTQRVVQLSLWFHSSTLCCRDMHRTHTPQGRVLGKPHHSTNSTNTDHSAARGSRVAPSSVIPIYSSVSLPFSLSHYHHLTKIKISSSMCFFPCALS